jgi:enterobactin synthetase component D
VTRAFDHPEFFRSTSLFVKSPGKLDGDGDVGISGHDHNRPGRDSGDDICGTECARIHSGPDNEQSSDLRSDADAAVFGARLLIGISKSSLENNSAYSGVKGRHLGDKIAAGGKADCSNPTGIDLFATREKIDRSLQRSSFGAAEFDETAALAVPRPIEQKNTIAGWRERSGMGQHSSAVAIAAVAKDDGRSVARRNVPAAEAASATRGKRNIHQTKARGIVGTENGPTGSAKASGLVLIASDRSRALPGDDDKAYDTEPPHQGHEVFTTQASSVLEDGDTATLITLPRESCQEWQSALYPFAPHPSRTGHVAIRLKSVTPDRILGELGWAHTVERLSVAAGGRAVTVEGALPERLKRAAPRRVADFLAGRHCAASALGAAGFDQMSTIGIAADGSPIWPAGFAGSITHSGGFATALIVPSTSYHSVGIDSEEVVSDDVAEAIRATVLTPNEIDNIVNGMSSGLDASAIITLAFSAKESVYKCLRPFADDFFEFHDVRFLDVDFAEGHLLLELARDLGAVLPRGMKLRSRFSIKAGRVNTVTVLNRLSGSLA